MQPRKSAANGKSKNSGGRRPIDGFWVPSRRWRQRAEAQAEGETAKKNAYTPHGNGKPGNRKTEGERWKGYENNKDWNMK